MYGTFKIINKGNKTIVGDKGTIIPPKQSAFLSEEENISLEDGESLYNYPYEAYEIP